MRIINKFWIICVMIFILHQLMQKVCTWQLSFIDSYLDPILSIPILMGLIALERNLWKQKLSRSKDRSIIMLSGFEISILTVFFAIIFEELFPRLSDRFVRDGYDYIAYGLGGILYYYSNNKEFKK